MKSTELRTLIKESIQEYIKEIDAAGNRAALEAKMEKTKEAIENRTNNDYWLNQFEQDLWIHKKINL